MGKQDTRFPFFACVLASGAFPWPCLNFQGIWTLPKVSGLVETLKHIFSFFRRVVFFHALAVPVVRDILIVSMPELDLMICSKSFSLGCRRVGLPT